MIPALSDEPAATEARRFFCGLIAFFGEISLDIGHKMMYNVI